MKPRALDLFCGAGGATRGLQLAGFHVTGVDLKPQPRYCGDAFFQADAMEFEFCAFIGGGRDHFPEICARCGCPYNDPRHSYDFVWASPVCKRYSQCTPLAYRDRHPDQIAPIRERLVKSGLPFTIENVPSAARRLRHPLMLCGSQFGLAIRRHRFFELSGFPLAELLAPCDHSKPPVLITGTHRRTYEPRYEYSAQQCRDASGLDWMTRTDMDQAIPPAYSHFIGRQVIPQMEGRHA